MVFSTLSIFFGRTMYCYKRKGIPGDSMHFTPVEVKVWGDFACFTRPEMKVERVSYEVMTPSAARGFLEAIFWKPEFQWEVQAIHVLRPIRYLSLLRNELKSRVAVSTIRRWAEQPGEYFAEDDRAQRHTLALRDVAYLIVADVRLCSGVTEHPAKYRDQFRRRVRSGQYHTAPYLGCREFTAFFSERDGSEQPVPVTADLGRMLFDLDYHPDQSGRGQPTFFDARMEEGVISIPSSCYDKRRRMLDAASTSA